MNRKSYVMKNQFRNCIQEKWEDDDGFLPGFYAARYYAELVDIFKNFYEAYPDMFQDDVLTKTWNHELSAIDKRALEDTFNNIYHYSDRKKMPGTGIVNQYALRIYVYDQKHYDPDLFCVEVIKLIQFRNIKIMDELEGRFLYDRRHGIQKVLNIHYLTGKEEGNYIKVKIPKKQLDDLLSNQNIRKR